MGRARTLAALLTAGAMLLCGVPASAGANVSSCASDPPPTPSPRLVRMKVDGLQANVLLPSGYRSSGARRYPVLYLLHGLNYNENTWLDLTDVERFTRPFTGGRAAIVVMPDGGPGGWYTNWPNGREHWETYHLRHLIPAIDGRFRTRANRRFRAVAGFSMGGYGALLYAARHPGTFAAAGGFSPISHITIPDQPYSGAPADDPRTGAGSPGPAHLGYQAYRPPDDGGSGCDGGSSQWGDGVRDAHWHGLNPTDLASSLRGLTVYVANGNGVPCGPDDPFDRPTFLEPGDAGTLVMTRDFYAPAARRAGAHVVTDFYGCGVHTMRYGERDLHAFWPVMTKAFGSDVPKAFRYRAVDADFSVRGWAFHADPKRATEFLEIRHASDGGLTLTGSGTETVVTGPLFEPRERVAVGGAKPRIARAGPRGRLTVRVDLGPPHAEEQFSGADQPDFVTRVIRFRAP
jgi:diacylglycerol O-acyltransferase/trehalose O-mycolyltransferase